MQPRGIGDNCLTDHAFMVELACIGWIGSATAATISFKVPLTGAEEIPPVTTAGKGNADLTWDPSTRVLTWDITHSGLTGSVTMGHFHNGPDGKMDRCRSGSPRKAARPRARSRAKRR